MQKNVLKKLFQSHKWDIVLGAALLLISLCLFLILKGAKKDGAYVEVARGNTIVGVYPLDKDAEYEFSDIYGNNTLVISDKKAYVKDSDCRDKICEKMNKISKNGEMIICLPNSLFIRITDKKGGEYDGISGQ